jgi:hypothetical protein
MNYIAVNPATPYLTDFENKITDVQNWYPLAITGILSLMSVVAILSLILRKL